MKRIASIIAFCAALALPATAQEDCTSIMRIFRDKEKICLAVPQDLLGQRLLMSSYLRDSSEQQDIPVGESLSASRAFRLAATDSLLLFLQPSAPFRTLDTAIVHAMAGSRTEAIVLALPIRSQDSLGRMVVEADKLFDPASKDVISLKGNTYGDNKVSAATYKKELSFFKHLTSSPVSVGVLRSVTFSLKLSGMLGFELTGDYLFSGDVETCLTLLPESSLPVLQTIPEIGTRSFSFQDIDPASEGYRTRQGVSRWNLSGDRTIKVYADTLLSPAWYLAVKEGILEWNRAFREAGLGDKISVERFPSKDFYANNPLVSTVVPGAGSAVGATITTDPQSGEILSFCLSVPSGFVSSIRRDAMVLVSDADPRFRSFSLPEDAVKDVLKAHVMRVMGQCLGLQRNMAGSYAYTPEELRDPVFTREHGISASATDDVVYNLLARPGDREKGVPTISSRIGAYDSYAIRWMYDETLDRSTWIKENRARRECLYLPQVSQNPDPRGMAGDLGSDPFETYRTVIGKLKWVAAESPAWIDSPEVDTSFKDLFADFIFLGADRVSRVLSAWIGGTLRDPWQPSYHSVPVKVQQQALETLLRDWRDFTWMDDKKALLTLAGANINVSTFSRTSAMDEVRLSQRLSQIARCEELCPSEAYPLRDALFFVEDILTENLRKGKTLLPGEEMLIARYANSLSKRNATYHEALQHMEKTVAKSCKKYSGTQRGRVEFILHILRQSKIQP